MSVLPYRSFPKSFCMAFSSTLAWAPPFTTDSGYHCGNFLARMKSTNSSFCGSTGGVGGACRFHSIRACKSQVLVEHASLDKRGIQELLREHRRNNRVDHPRSQTRALRILKGVQRLAIHQPSDCICWLSKTSDALQSGHYCANPAGCKHLCIVHHLCLPSLLSCSLLSLPLGCAYLHPG